jgi:hypothetical protein
MPLVVLDVVAGSEPATVTSFVDRFVGRSSFAAAAEFAASLKESASGLLAADRSARSSFERGFLGIQGHLTAILRRFDIRL